MPKRMMIIVSAIIMQAGTLYCTEIMDYGKFTNVMGTKIYEMKINNITLEQKSNSYLQTLGAGDINLSASGELSGAVIESNAGSFIIDSTSSSLLCFGASKKFLETGTALSTTLSYQQANVITHNLVNTGQANNTLLIPALTLSVSQPLLKNAFGMDTRNMMWDAGIQRDIQKIQTEADNFSSMASYSLVYFQWIGQIKTLEFLQKSLSNAQASERLANAQLNAGLIDNDDYQSTRNLALQYSSSVMHYEQALGEITNQLSRYFSAESTIPLSDDWEKTLTLVRSTNLGPVPFESTRNGKIYLLNRERLVESVKLSSNQLYPDLSLYGSLTFSGVAGNFYGSLTNSLSRPDAAVGLNLNFPLENSDAINSLKNKELSLKSQDLLFRLSRQNYEVRMKNLLEKLETEKKILENTQLRITALNSMHAAQTLRHKQGRLTQNELDDTQIKIAQEEMNLVDTQYSLITLYFNYQSLIF